MDIKQKKFGLPVLMWVVIIIIIIAGLVLFSPAISNSLAGNVKTQEVGGNQEPRIIGVSDLLHAFHVGSGKRQGEVGLYADRFAEIRRRLLCPGGFEGEKAQLSDDLEERKSRSFLQKLVLQS